MTDLLARGGIVRVKKGLYIFGEKWRRKPYSREILANLLYGPSCVSFDYALHYPADSVHLKVQQGRGQ